MVELARLSLWLFIQFRDVDHNLPFRVEPNLGTIHRPWRRPLKVDGFTVVATPVTGTLKLVFARPPVWSAAEMRAAGINNEYPVRSFVDPNAILLLPLGIDPECIVGRKPNAKYAGWFEN